MPNPLTTFVRKRRRNDQRNVASNANSEEPIDGVPEESSPSSLSTTEPSPRLVTPRTPHIFATPDRSPARRDPMGLQLVHEPETSPALDIIFVHGAGGSSRATWSNGRDLEYFWPQKLLSIEPGIRTARILTFGYNPIRGVTGPAPITGISGFAEDLLNCMKEDEHAEELALGQRPIIFIVHSIGGLVVKQAFVLGHDQDCFRDIVSNISAIIFLATPHSETGMSEVLDQILAASVSNYDSKHYNRELSIGSQQMEILNERFLDLASGLIVRSFHETLETSVGTKEIMVLEAASAKTDLPNEILTPLEADHNSICSFDSSEHSNYVTVRNSIKSLVTSVRSRGRTFLAPKARSEVEQLETLLAITDAYRDDLQFFSKRWTKGTCGGTLRDDEFLSWKNEEHGTAILWMHAVPGNGKSVLSSFLINSLREEYFCVYYFFRFQDQTKKSLSNCLRSIAFQIAEQLPPFRQALREIQFSSKSLEKIDARTIWEKVFVEVLFRMKFTTTQFWIIDALDEADHPKLLVDMMQSIAESRTIIKVILISRHTMELLSSFERYPAKPPVVYLPLKDRKRDIRSFLEHEVQLMHAPLHFKSEIVSRLAAASGNNFLWTRLALDAIWECSEEDEIDEILRGMPSGMNEFYQRMERTLNDRYAVRPRDRILGRAIFTWTVCSRRPLLIDELIQALHPTTIAVTPKTAISRVCGQFVLFDATDHVLMIHQTARDHITSEESTLAINTSHGQEQCFKKCMSVLEAKRPPLRESSPLEFRYNAEHRVGGQSAADSQQFVRYAITSWPYHLDRLSSESQIGLTALIGFLKGYSILAWITSLASQNLLRLLVSASRSMSLFVRRRRARDADNNPIQNRSEELEFIDSWATDLLKILGKFGENLLTNPTTINHEIPPFCPKNSAIYQEFNRRNVQPYALSVEGLSKVQWDDSLARLSLGTNSRARNVISSADSIAVQTDIGNIVLFDAITFEVKRTLIHSERISAMTFDSSAKRLATCGFRTTKVWCVDSGDVLYKIANPHQRAFSVSFLDGDLKLIIGSTDALIREANLTVAMPEWTIVHPNLLKEESTIDRQPGHHMPWRISFSPDANHIAVAYRDFPLTVFSLDPPRFVGRCFRNRDFVGNRWTVVDYVVWHPKSEELLGLYMGGEIFRWNPINNSQQEIKAEASILAVSPGEGRFFATGDSQGTIKLYNFQHFTLVYTLSCEDVMNNLCFSPDEKRLYDVRGQFCNVWEPNVLIRIDDAGEQESDTGSEFASLPTQSISESFSEVRDQITAIATQFRGRWQAIGNEVGVVSIIDSDDKHIAVQLWRAPVALSIGHLHWSADGNYLACYELTGRIVVMRVELEDGLKWVAVAVFEPKLTIHAEGIQQVLLNDNGTMLFVKNGPNVTVYPVPRPATDSMRQQHSIEKPDTTWVQHSTDPTLLLSIEPASIQVYKWKDLSEVAILEFDSSLTPADTTVTVNSVLTASPSPRVLISSTNLTADVSKDVSSLYYIPEYFSSASRETISITTAQIPPEVHAEIEMPLGILSKAGLVFLDKKFWVCSYRLDTPKLSLDKRAIVRWYFLPKDWLNAECLQFCRLLANGTLLIPNNGELAFIRCGGLR